MKATPFTIFQITTAMANKKELRKKYKELRLVFNENDIDQMSIAIANQVLLLNIWQKTYFHLFLPIKNQNEVNTEFLLSALQGKDKEIIVSKSNFETTEMTHFLLTDNTFFKKNEFGIPEPIDGIDVPISKLDVVFIPLLAFDNLGNRVGYGKGFYDKFLVQCKPQTVKIGLSFFEPENFIQDLDQCDIKLDICISPKKIYFFDAKYTPTKTTNAPNN